MKKGLHVLAIATLSFNIISVGCESKENSAPDPTRLDDGMHLTAIPTERLTLEATVTAEVTATTPMLPETSSVSVEITPYEERKNINGVLMTKMGANGRLFSVDLTITQNKTLTVGGIDISDWWIDPDFFTKTGAQTLSFLPITGKYRIIADVECKYFKVQVMSGDALASLQEDGSGAVWAIGGVGNPTTANLVEWNPNEAVCLAPMGNGRYKLSGVGGQRFRTGELGIKFQPRHDSWEPILRPDAPDSPENDILPKYAPVNNDFIRVDDSLRARGPRLLHRFIDMATDKFLAQLCGEA
ncbi:MAG: DUF5125 domain-containing protein [Prevotellaceae bacterium]|jgi:hypothetical protein|nr:DUF5125 domain-containing protein [Prevotellaceae bacterium]